MKWRVVLCVWVACGLAMETVHVVLARFSYTAEPNCVEYPLLNYYSLGRSYDEGWQSHNMLRRKILTKRSFGSTVQFTPGHQATDQRSHIVGNIIPSRSDSLLEEHAKLVQDINSLRQFVFISPFREENRDYDESIFHEIIETTSTTYKPPYAALQVSSTWNPGTSSRQPLDPIKTSLGPSQASSIPIILLGGASQRQVVKSQPLNFAKPTVSLVGTTISPLLKHPYPFVMQTTPRKPYRLCMTTVPTFPAKRASLWERLIDFILPGRNRYR